MRKLIPLVLLLALPAGAQVANINTPVTRNSITQVKVKTFACDASTVSCLLTVRYQDASNNDIDVSGLGFVTTVSVPSGVAQPCTGGTTVSGLATAMNNARASETGGAARIQQFRILGYFLDQGCFSQAVTLAP